MSNSRRISEWFGVPYQPEISIEDQRYMELKNDIGTLADEIKKLTLQNMRLNEIIRYICDTGCSYKEAEVALDTTDKLKIDD